MILVDGGSSVNILYDHALDRIDDTPELARKLIIPQTQSLLYGFDGRNSLEYSGPTGPPNAFRPEKPRSRWHM